MQPSFASRVKLLVHAQKNKTHRGQEIIKLSRELGFYPEAVDAIFDGVEFVPTR